MELIRGRLRSWDSAALAFLILWPFILFWKVAFGIQTFYGSDIYSLFYPLRVELARALTEGRLPLWTPYLGSGFPVFAEGHIAALYPLNLVLYRLLPTLPAFSFSILFHLAWGAVGMFLFCRSSGLRVASAFVAGFVFGFSGFAIAHLQHLTLEAAASWLPWLLLFQNEMQRARRDGKLSWWRWFVLIVLSIAIQFFAGFPQVALLNLIPFCAISVFGPAFWNRPSDKSAPSRAREVLKSVGLTVLSIALGMGIAAIQLLPAYELLGLSVRAQELGEEFFTGYSIHPEMLTQFVFPFGNLGEPSISNIEYWGYLGVMPLLLIVAAVWRRRDVRTWFFLVFSLCVLIFALGKFTPVYDWLYYVPVFNRFRVPARFLLLLTLAASFLAATGFDGLQDRLNSSTGKHHVTAFIVIPATLVTVGILVIGDSQSADSWLRVWQVFPWFFVLLAGGAMLLVVRRAARALFVTAVLGLIVIDLALFAQPFSTTLNTLASPSELTQMSRPLQIMDTGQSMYRMFTTVFNENLTPNRPLVNEKPSAQIYSPLALRRNEDYLFIMSPAMLDLLNVRYYARVSNPTEEDIARWGYSFGLDLFKRPEVISPTRAASVEVVSYANQTQELTNGFLAGEIELTLANETRLALPIRIGIETADWASDGFDWQTEHTKPSKAIHFPGYLVSLRRPFEGAKYVYRYPLPAPLDVVGVSARSNLPANGLVIESVSLIDESGRAASLAVLAHRNDLSLVFKSHAVAVFENRDVLPRAFLVHASDIVQDDAMLARMREPGFDPSKVILLSDGQPLRTPISGSSSGESDVVTITEYKPERVVVRVSTDAEGYLVLTDSWYPGWNAKVDNQPTAIERADYAFRAVRVTPGAHEIVFEYQPTSFYLGAMVSGVSVLLCGVLAVFWNKEIKS